MDPKLFQLHLYLGAAVFFLTLCQSRRLQGAFGRFLLRTEASNLFSAALLKKALLA
jgi:hypothetical protein